MKISHELPPSLFKHSYSWNNYDYCLPHLLNKYPEYQAYFEKAKKDGRFIIMDNGLFEGANVTNRFLIEKIVEFEPNIFIVPDEWNASARTFRNAKYWFNTFKSQLPSKTNLMVVMQGRDGDELVNLYKDCIDLGYTHFAFNHSSEAYQLHYNHPNKLVNQMMGRINTISRILRLGLIQPNHYIHLLGCSLPQEMLYYGSSFPGIQSVDTSNPIIYGALGKNYNSWGILDKPTQKIEEFFDKDLEGKIGDITFNINKFRGFIEQKIMF